MKSLLHCVWTGASFPYRLRAFIKEWVPYLRKSNSEFELVVWLTNDSYQAASEYLSKGFGNSLDQKNWGKLFPGMELLLNKAKINFNTFYISLIEPLLAHYPPTLQRVFDMLHDHKYYTSVSNIARVLIVNSCGGIYTDIDYLLPNYDLTFPKNINEILDIFQKRNRIGFYMSMTCLTQCAEVENQCLILDPQNTHSLDTLIRDMNSFMVKRFEEIRAACIMNIEFLGHSATKSLAKSMFSSEHEGKFLEAYKKKSSYNLGQASIATYKGEVHKVDLPFSAIYGLRQHLNIVDDDGARFYHYKAIAMCTYSKVCDYFSRKLSVDGDEIYHENWVRFKALFSEKDVDQQYQFKTKSGNACGMYSWAHPGYARLNSLESAVHSVEKYYIPKKYPNRVPIRLINKFFENIKVFIIGSPNTADFASKASIIQNEISRNSRDYYMSGFKTIYTLQDIFKLIREYEGLGFAVELLNEQIFCLIRVIIDPEKKVLTAEDIEAFIRI